MASFSYLWANRARPPFGSKRFFRAWAKRVLLLPDVWRMNARRSRLIRKGAQIDNRAEIGLARIDGPKSKLTIGPFSFIGRVYMALHADVRIGSNVCINDGVEILTASHDVADPQWRQFARAVIIEDYAWIGSGAMILPGVTVGRGAVVGARAVVSKNVEAGTVVAGNPAKATSKTRDSGLNYNPCEFLAANQAWLLDE